MRDGPYPAGHARPVRVRGVRVTIALDVIPFRRLRGSGAVGADFPMAPYVGYYIAAASRAGARERFRTIRQPSAKIFLPVVVHVHISCLTMAGSLVGYQVEGCAVAKSRSIGALETRRRNSAHPSLRAPHAENARLQLSFPTMYQKKKGLALDRPDLSELYLIQIKRVSLRDARR